MEKIFLPKWIVQKYARKNVFRRICKELEQLHEKYKPQIFFIDDDESMLIMKDYGNTSKFVISMTLGDCYPFVEPAIRIAPNYQVHRLDEWNPPKDNIVEYVDSLFDVCFEAESNDDFIKGNKEYKNSKWTVFWFVEQKK